jgi:hypothetical protein
VTLLTVLASGAVILTFAASTFLFGWRHLRPAWRMLVEMLGDWHGHPARPGVPRQAGVMERLALLEELRTNGGTSVKDQVARIATAVGAEEN